MKIDSWLNVFVALKIKTFNRKFNSESGERKQTIFKMWPEVDCYLQSTCMKYVGIK